MGIRLSRLIPGLLRDNGFRTYWMGYSLSQVGDQVGLLAVPLTAVLVLHADAAAMGVLSAVGLIPALLFSIHAGAWVDRLGHRRRVMIVADVARAALLAYIPLAYWLGWLTLRQLLTVAFLVGSFSVLFRVSSNILFVSLVSQEDYVEAQSLLQGSRAAAFLVGPGLGGFLVQLLSAPLAVLADAVSFVGSAISLGRIAPGEPAVATPRPGYITAGLRFAWASPVLRALLASLATISFFRSAFFALYVLYATRSLHITPAELGIILGPGSVGAVVGSMIAGRVSGALGLGRALFIGALLYTVPILLVPLAGGSHLIVLAFLFVAECLSGMGLMTLEISNGAIRAAAVPDPLRARVGGAMGFVTTGIRPVGALLGGLLPSLIGLHPTLWVATVGAALGCLWLLPSPITRLREVADFLPSAGHF